MNGQTQMSYCNTNEVNVCQVLQNITEILEKYTDQIELMDIIEIVDNLRTLANEAKCA